MIRKNYFKAAALALSLLALSPSSDIFGLEAKHSERHQSGIKPAQANYQDTTTLHPLVNKPIPFSVKNFNQHVKVNHARSVFEVEIPGLYSIDAFLLVNLPSFADSIGGYITINKRKLLTFYTRETRTDANNPVVEVHFNDRLVYLEKGDKVSVVLSEFPAGATILARGFVLVALNNSN